MAVNRIKKGSYSEQDIYYWTISTKYTWTCGSIGDINYWTNISSGDWISQVVDFTNAPLLTYSVRSSYGFTTTIQTYIDGVLIHTATSVSREEDKTVSIDVSAYSGEHTLKFVLTGGNPMSFGNVELLAYPPVAGFSCTPVSGEAPLTVQYTDVSTYSPTVFLWDFGDGSVSTEQNPSHTYTKAGTYSITLTVTNSVDSNTKIKSDYITVTAVHPIVRVLDAVSAVSSVSGMYTDSDGITRRFSRRV